MTYLFFDSVPFPLTVLKIIACVQRTLFSGLIIWLYCTYPSNSVGRFLSRAIT